LELGAAGGKLDRAIIVDLPDELVRDKELLTRWLEGNFNGVRLDAHDPAKVAIGPYHRSARVKLGADPVLHIASRRSVENSSSSSLSGLPAVDRGRASVAVPCACQLYLLSARHVPSNLTE
jgi:hypothetical protein